MGNDEGGWLAAGRWRSASEVRVELDLNRDARALVAERMSVANAAVAADPHFDRAYLPEVAPPVLALGPADVDGHPIPVLPVADRERVAAAAPPPRDRDQGQTATQQWVQRRAQHRLHDGIGGAVEHRERRVTLRHARDVIAVGTPRSRRSAGSSRHRKM